MTEDARERAMREPWFRAWDKWSNEHDGGDGYYVADGFEIGYGIAKREDEQRVAELVAAAEALCRAYYNPDSPNPQPHLDALHVALRALGQSEEVKP